MSGPVWKQVSHPGRPAGLLSWLRDMVTGPRHRLALAVGLLAVVAALVGMHQMSLNHNLITGQASSFGHHPAQQPRPHADPVVETAFVTAVPGQALHERSPEASHSFEDGSGGGCDAGCHQGAMAACLLVLTLAGVARLRRPTSRLLSPTRRRTRSALTEPVARGWRPALSLAELSLRRT